MTKREEIIKTLSEINVNQYIEKKMGLSYLSWANAWAILTQYYPDATYKFTEYPEYIPDVATKQWLETGRTVDYRLTPAGCEVTATVRINDEDFTMSLYVMDNRNKVVRNPDYAQINKTQQRCLVKALALAGLGLNVYQGEDLPTGENIKQKGVDPEQQKKAKELGEEKTRYQELFSKVVNKSKCKPADLTKKLTDSVKDEQDLLKKYKGMNDRLEAMLKESGESGEQMTFEEVQ